jgi:hypothetical protein
MIDDIIVDNNINLHLEIFNESSLLTAENFYDLILEKLKDS